MAMQAGLLTSGSSSLFAFPLLSAVAANRHEKLVARYSGATVPDFHRFPYSLPHMGNTCKELLQINYSMPELQVFFVMAF
jgi:hypothetical protein